MSLAVLLWRVQVKPDDILQLFHEPGVPTQFEGSSQVRLQAMAPPDTTDRTRAQSHHFGQTPSAPVRSRHRRLLRRLAHDLSDRFLANRAQPPGPRGILQDAGDPLLGKTTAPNTNRPSRCPRNLSDLSVLLALADSRTILALFATHGDLPATSKLLKLSPLQARGLSRRLPSCSLLAIFHTRKNNRSSRISDPLH
jgi:hypothetical protein